MSGATRILRGSLPGRRAGRPRPLEVVAAEPARHVHRLADEGQPRLALLERQREIFQQLLQRRSELMRQLESAGLALDNLRLDLIKFQSSGLQTALSDVSTATQEARALSRDIDALLDAAAEMKSL